MGKKQESKPLLFVCIKIYVFLYIDLLQKLQIYKIFVFFHFAGKKALFYIFVYVTVEPQSTSRLTLLRTLLCTVVWNYQSVLQIIVFFFNILIILRYTVGFILSPSPDSDVQAFIYIYIYIYVCMYIDFFCRFVDPVF